MTLRNELESLVSQLKNIENDEKVELQILKDSSKGLESILTSADGPNLLKQQNKYFESVLTLYVQIIFSDDPELIRSNFKHVELITEIFRSKLPKIKKGDWWKQFEQEYLVQYIPKLLKKISSSDDTWVYIWSFSANLIISDTALSTVSLNKLLSISEAAFKKGKENSDIMDQAWKCWSSLIDAFGRYPKILLPAKKLNLLQKPLLACYSISKYRITTWVHLIEVKGIPAPEDSLMQLVESMCKAMYYAPGDKSISRHLPNDCGEALVKLLSLQRITEYCLLEIILLYGAVINSRPSVDLIEKLTGSLVTSINQNKDDVSSYKQWKALIDQYKSSCESPILKQACQIVFTDINFHRWLDSGILEGKDIHEFMHCAEFRSKVLVRSIAATPTSEDDENVTPSKKGKKYSWEAIWSKFCEAYLSWWSNATPSRAKDSEMLSPDSNSNQLPRERDSFDYQNMLALIMQPLTQQSWNPTIYKTWSLICEVCYKHRLLNSMIKQIIEVLENQIVHLQKIVDIFNCLWKLDNTFCKLSVNVLEKLTTAINSTDLKNITELLTLLELGVSFNEMSPVTGKILKVINEKCSEFDQLNAHKIRTKVGKISRKIEQNTNSSEKEKNSKPQRTPFRTQSNFLQRLAKAEGKNKVKNNFMSNVFSNSEKGKALNDDPDNEMGVSELSSQESVQEAIKGSDDMNNKNSLKHQDDTEVVAIVMPLVSPTALKENMTPVKTDGTEVETENAIAAEKENVILPSSTPLAIASPVNKMKITNARELKTTDTSSPTLNKKKPVAGHKITPKKTTPSKVSYFDDDASDFVMVPPKPKTTPLTSHQMEMMSKRRTDIPALYQDLSQDTQLSNSCPSQIIQQVTGNASTTKSTPESEEIVSSTPSPITHGTSKGKNVSSKKLDFSSLAPSPQTPRGNDICNLLGNKVGDLPTDAPSSPLESNPENKINADVAGTPVKTEVMVINSVAAPASTQMKDNGETPNEENNKIRKRKSAPTKLSPKVTRSRKSLNAQADRSKTSTQNKGNSIEPVNTPVKTSSSCEEKHSQELTIVTQVVDQSTDKPPSTDSDNRKSELANSASDQQKPNEEKDNEINGRQPIDKRGQKRKNCESSPDNSDTKKNKIAEKESYVDDNSGTPMKNKKKKKILKLSSGINNLESWLVKTDRLGNSTTKTNGIPAEVNQENDIEPSALPANPKDTLDLNNSEEIVPGSQELEKTSLLLTPNSVSSTPVKVINDNMSTIPSEGDNTNESNCAKTDTISPPDCSEKIETTEGPETKESPDYDDIDLINSSPSKRQRRATSVMRGEGDTYLNKDKSINDCPEEDGDDDPAQRSLRNRKKVRKNYQAGGRSARMLRLAASSTPQEEETSGLVTPKRRRESIVPLKYGENWPTGPTEEWVACTPISPYTSPFRSALKKFPSAPGDDDEGTPKHSVHDLLSSPLLSSAKRKRVVFLDPPVTRGLIYERDSPFGAIHLADVPRGSPYPTWKGEEETELNRKPWSISFKEEKSVDTSPQIPENIEAIVDAIKSESNEDIECLSPPKPSSVTGEVEGDMDIDRETPEKKEPEVTSAPSPSDDSQSGFRILKRKFQLDDSFIESFSECNLKIRTLLIECLESPNMKSTVDNWKIADWRSLCQLSHSFLCRVKNVQGETLATILSEVQWPYMTSAQSLQSIGLQTSSPSLKTTETQAACVSKHSFSQTVDNVTNTATTNTVPIDTTDGSSQADLSLPTFDELTPVLKRLGLKRALEYVSDSLRLLSTFQELDK